MLQVTGDGTLTKKHMNDAIRARRPPFCFLFVFHIPDEHTEHAVESFDVAERLLKFRQKSDSRIPQCLENGRKAMATAPRTRHGCM